LKIFTWFVYSIFYLLFLFADRSSAQHDFQSGTLSGKVYAADTQAPLAGANIVVLNSVYGAATDTAGIFIIYHVPVGSYTLEFSYLGYETQFKSDIIVRSRRLTILDVYLNPTVLETELVQVYGNYFTEDAAQPASTINFSAEEIRRAPGSAGDVSRILMSLPSLAKINDESNSLIVRGGSPVENAFYVDNIEIPNINHFPIQGASGGPIGLLQVDFIRDVNFSSGGYPAPYGDKLSSVMEISFREGNRTEFDGQLDLNFGGFGGTFEGPLSDQQGSWLMSIRRSYLKYLLRVVDMGTTAAPSYGDFQGKLVYDLNSRHRLSALLILGDDHNNPDSTQAEENDMIYYGNQDIYETTAGLNWRALWTRNAYSNTSLSYTSSRFIEDSYETGSNLLLFKNRSLEQMFKLRNLNHITLHPDFKIETGVEVKYIIHRYNNYYGAYTDPAGSVTPASEVNVNIRAWKPAYFINLIYQPFPAVTVTAGERFDYFSVNQNIHASPRFSLLYRLNRRISVHLAAGMYVQNLPLLLLAQQPDVNKISDPAASHFIIGLNHLLNESTKFTVELYQKKYHHFPLDPEQKGFFLLDELFYRYGHFYGHTQMVDKGAALSRGIECTLQKKLAAKVYGLASIAYFRSRYQGLDGIWRDRVFDNRLLFSMEGGFKPNSNWEFSLRWLYAGGPPYTPLNLAESQQINRAVLDEQRINAARYPDYHSLNLRVDRRYHYSNSNLVFYLSLWNAYNRNNVATYFWDQQENQQGTLYQWGLLPIFGIEFEF
jgi:hypothetical protein